MFLRLIFTTVLQALVNVNFLKLIINNIEGKENVSEIGNYDEGVLMLMYDDVVIVNERELLRDYHD